MTDIQRTFDHLTVLSASGALIDETLLNSALERLSCLHLPVLELPNTRSRLQRFAGSDSERVQAVQMAVKMKQSSLILATRGGYGISRILDKLDLQELGSFLNTYQHLLVGHSDLTALQLALLANGAQPQTLLHGPMLCFDFGPECGIHNDSWKWFESAALNGQIEVSWSGTFNADAELMQVVDREQEVHLSGPAWGGNLSMVCSLLGSEYLMAPPAGILILEDVNEPAYKIERMLLQLFHAGILQDQQAVIMGQFGEPKPTEHDDGYSLGTVSEYLADKAGLPVISGFPFGHVTPKACFFQGAVARLQIADAMEEGAIKDRTRRFKLTQQVSVV